MSADELEEMGPIDYLVVEWPDRQPTGEAAPILVDLVDRGLIRVIDIAFLAKGEDGSVTTLELSVSGRAIRVAEGARWRVLGAALR